MKCNVGNEDAFWRAVIGITIAFIGWYFRGWWGFLGIALIATAVLCFCPVYKLFGISTFKKERDRPGKKDVR